MPVNLETLEKLEKLLVRTDLPVQKKVSLNHNIGRVHWLKENFDVKNRNHPKRDEIMALIDEILASE